MRDLRKSLRDDEFNDVVATVINRLGKPDAGAADPLSRADFNVNTFVREYDKLTSKAKDILMLD